jgi:hypothetical protein
MEERVAAGRERRCSGVPEINVRTVIARIRFPRSEHCPTPDLLMTVRPIQSQVLRCGGGRFTFSWGEKAGMRAGIELIPDKAVTGNFKGASQFTARMAGEMRWNSPRCGE